MTENFNPFDAENLITGGGLWDGKVVTILSAKTCLDPMARRDGTPVLNEQTGQQAVRHVLQITGIADDEEKERVEKYSAGGLMPTADGEGFQKPDGTPGGKFHANSEMGKFTAGIQSGGFDTKLLFKDGKTRVSGLIGARFLMKGEPLKNKEGKVKINDKGFEQMKFYPVEFKGFSGKAAAATPGADYAPKAAETVLAILSESNGKVSRADLIRKISQKLAGDPDVNKVLALISKDDFHKDQPWTRDGTGYSL
jgi:hypothetical protein